MGHGLIHLAYDAGPAVGLGHRRRMEALARAMPGATTIDLSRGGRVAGDVVVVDSYRHRADGDVVDARRVVAVDDLGRDLAVDLLVDPSDPEPGAATAPVGVLRGFIYSLVDPALASRPVRPIGRAERIVVATGGADRTGVGARVASALAGRLTGVRVRLVVGPWSASRVPPGVERVDAPEGLADELAAADVVVTAAGVTMTEALALGRPTVAFATAGNQHRALYGAARAGAVLSGGPEQAAGVAVRLVGDEALRRRLADAGRALIDGGGAHRVAAAVRALV